MIDGPTASAAIVQAGFTHLVWIPDSHLGLWDAALSRSPLAVVRLTREGEAVAIAAGLLLGGAAPLVAIQCTGFFEAGDAVRNVVHDLGLPLLPGVATGSEIMMAQEDGLTELKFFPAMQAGGLAMLKAWQGPFGDVKFCPTGGIHAGNAHEFLALSNVACVGGSWIVPTDAIAAGDWARIEALAREASQLAR